MTLQQLKYIVSIDEYRHFGKAAQACDITQSTLSLMVKKLEEELDVRIFDREAYPVAVTEIGRKIIDQAKVVLFNAEQIEEITRNEIESMTGTVSIALISTVAPVLVPGLYKYFGDNYPTLSLVTEEMITDTIIDKLRKAEIDMGIVTSPVRDPELLEIPLYSERFFAFISQNDPLYTAGEIKAKALRDRPIWIMRNGVRLIDNFERQEGESTYEHYFEGGRVGTLMQIVNENGGLTIIPETHIKLTLYSWHEKIRPIVDPEPRRTISLAIRKDYIHEAQLNVVVRAIKSIIPGVMLENTIRKEYIKL